MSYEYKDLIKTYIEYIMDDYEVVDYIEAGKELDHVYKQAAKADEYEVKAKAFDDIEADYENNTGLGEHDEDLTDFLEIVDSIDHAIQMVDIERSRRETNEQ